MKFVLIIYVAFFGQPEGAPDHFARKVEFATLEECLDVLRVTRLSVKDGVDVRSVSYATCRPAEGVS